MNEDEEHRYHRHGHNELELYNEEIATHLILSLKTMNKVLRLRRKFRRRLVSVAVGQSTA
jgi:hypothetical protein